MLWVVKSTVSMRRFILAPTHMLKLRERKYLQFTTESFCLSEPVLQYHYYDNSNFQSVVSRFT